jgi:hypothetical protein
MLLAAGAGASAQTAVPRPGASAARLIPAASLSLPGDVDSNSPAVWALVDGQQVLHVLTSTAGTDKHAGAVARFFMGGVSTHLIEFTYRVW